MSARFGFALLVAICASASVSRADTPRVNAEAEAHLARGVELRREKREKDALEEFRSAFAVEPTARARAQVALAEDAMGLWVEAEEALVGALAATDDAWIERHRAALVEELGHLRSHLADLDVDVSPSGAEISINGTPARRTGGARAFRVVSGRVYVRATAAGYEAAERTLELAPASHETVSLSLEPIEHAAGEAPGGVRQATTAPSDVSPRDNHQMPPAIDRHPQRRALVFSFLAAAGSSFTLATAALIKRNQLAGTYNDDASCSYGGVPRAVRCADVSSGVDRYATIMTVGYASAAALAAVGGILALTTPSVRVDVSAPSRNAAMLSFRRDF